MSKSLLFYGTRDVAVLSLILVLIAVILEASPIIKVLSLVLIPVIKGLLTPINDKKGALDVDILAIQNINKEAVVQNSFSGMPFTVFASIILAAILLFINAFILPLSIESKINFAIAAIITGCLYPFCYQGATAITLRYAKILK